MTLTNQGGILGRGPHNSHHGFVAVAVRSPQIWAKTTCEPLLLRQKWTGQ